MAYVKFNSYALAAVLYLREKKSEKERNDSDARDPQVDRGGSTVGILMHQRALGSPERQ